MDKKKKTKPEVIEEEVSPEVQAANEQAANEEKLRELIERGKQAGKLSSKELLDVLEEMSLEPDQLDKFYDTLENLGIETTGEDYLATLEEDEQNPAVEELKELELVE